MGDSNASIPTPSQEMNESENREVPVHPEASEVTVEKDSEKSNVSSESGGKVIKPSGLKQPGSGIATPSGVTRIGRPCNNVPKPAIPRQNSAGFGAGGGTMASVSSVRKISDELARRRISDLNLTEEGTLPLYAGGRWNGDRKSSSGSVLSDSSRKSSSDDLRRKKSSDGSLSMDSSGDLWKFDYEPRRASDISVVLTQDTDSFIIGDRVWVGGTKPGQIAYIGETQFAPGDWAGVVLDEPIGKNDGSVANIRYFQCEPKRGIFSRLTRLTRYPLLDGNSTDYHAPPRTLPLESGRNNDVVTARIVPKSRSSPVPTPTTPSSKSVFSKPSSPDSSIHPNVTVGDRVIVMSSQGSKAGVLRFLGATDFAPGEWCGVELDDPLGKNDGSVAGTRYFECRPKFGLFAPLHKVSKSPASKRPSQASCQIHRGGGSMGIRRGSKESLASMSSAASTTASVRSTARKVGVRTPTTPTSTKNALQEILKEKELHIEQLLKERDLERAEVTRAASQADEAEKRLSALQQEFEQGKEELEARIADLDAMMCLLKAENEELAGQLEEEKRKYEDVQFRFEEVSIESGDLKSTIKNLEEKASALEKTLADERKRLEVLELESNKLFEAEEQLVMIKDENDTLKESLAENEKIRKSMEQENISLEAIVTAMRAEINSLKTETEAVKAAAQQDDGNMRDSLTKTMKALEEVKLDLVKKQREVEELSTNLETREKEFAARQREMTEKNSALVEEMKQKHNLEMEELNSKINELKISSELKRNLLEEKLNERMAVCNELETRMQECSLELSRAASDKSAEDEKRREIEENMRKELKQSREMAQKVTSELATEVEKSRNLEQTIDELKKIVEEAREGMLIKEKEASEFSNIINKQKDELETLRNEAANTSQELIKHKESLNVTVRENTEKETALNSAIQEKTAEVEKLTKDLEELKKNHEDRYNKEKGEHEKERKELEAKISALENESIEKGKLVDISRKELEDGNMTLKAKESELENEKNAKQTLMEKLEAAENAQKMLFAEKENLLLEVGDSNRKLQTLEEKLMQTVKQKDKLENDLASFINTSNDSSLQLSKLNEELRAKEKEMDELREELSKRTGALERAEQEYRQTLSSKENEFSAKEKTFAENEKQLLQNMEKLQIDLENMRTKSRTTEVELKNQLEHFKKESEGRMNSLKNEITELQRADEQNREKHSMEVNKLEKARNDLEEILVATKDELNKVKNSSKKQEEDFFAEKEKLKAELELMRAEGMRIQTEIAERAKEELATQSSENNKLRDEIREASDQLQKAIKEVEDLKKFNLKVEEEKTMLLKNISKLESNITVKEVEKTEVEAQLSAGENEKKILRDSLAQLREERLTFEKNLTEKEMVLTEMRLQLESAEEWRKKFEESEGKSKVLEEMCKKLEVREKSLTEEAQDKDKQIQILNQEKSSLVEALEMARTTNQTNAEAAKQKLETSREEAAKREKEVVEMMNSLKKAMEDVESERKKNREGEKKITEMEREMKELAKKIQEQQAGLEKNHQLEKMMEEMNQRAVREGKVQEELSKTVQEKNLELEKYEMEMKNLSCEVERLKREKESLLNNNKVTVESLEKEKTQLQMKINEMETSPSPGGGGGQKNGQNEEYEDQDFKKGQVDFLNSIIVDMQKKNDALKARIEILELGFMPEDVEDFTLEDLKMKKVAPRLYCDICEVFDAHDTEDCPKQAMDAEEEAPPRGNKTKVLPPERPYCEICEVFGHDTADCDDTETF